MELPTFDPGFSTPEMTAVFTASARIDKMLAFEAALAEAEADAGIISNEVAGEIAVACAARLVDPDLILARGWEAGTPLIPLLNDVMDRLSTEGARWLHHGATSQDAIDTALMLQMREGLALLNTGLTGIARRLRDLALLHRSTPMMARTLLQPAAPTVFGFEVARWLEPVVRHVIEIKAANDGLVVQLGGATGNLFNLGEHALSIVDGVAKKLGLAAPIVPWHADRSRVSAAIATVERAARSMAKIATDIVLLSQAEIGEIRVRAGGSSSLPGKRNPIDAVQALAAAEVSTAAARLVTGGRPHELDRAIAGWHTEWLAVPLVFHAGAAAVAAIGRCLLSMEVDAERMKLNLGDAQATESIAAIAMIDRVLALHDMVLGN